MKGKGDRPIFVVGCARSGTTLLQSMIHAHPRLAMPPENRFMIPVYSARTQFGDLRDPANVTLLADRLTQKGTRLKDLGLKRSKVRERLYETPPTVGSMLGSVLMAFAELHGKPRWGDKRPNYIKHLPEIMALFPDAQIVHIIRDGRDSAASLSTMPWWTRGFEPAVYKWRDAIEAGNAARSSLPADAYTEVRYEDLVAEPRRTLKALCRFLDERFDKAMLYPSRVADITPDYKVWHENLQKPVNANAVRRWERDLTRDQVNLFEHVAGPHLMQHGYELSDNASPPSPEILEVWASVEARDGGVDARHAKAEQERRAAYEHPVAALLTTGQRRLAAAQGWLDEYSTPPGPPPAET